MRLFIALLLNEEMRRAIGDVQRELKRRGVQGRYSKPENLHLTLAFIGEYPDADAAQQCIDAAAFRPLSLRLEGIGAFGDTWWLGLTANPQLDACVRRLRRELGAAGIPFDRKRFAPHITLLRRAVAPETGMPGIEVPHAEMRADHISLMRSDRSRDGMIYTEIG